MAMSFTAAELPALFNEWMRQFTENPNAFQAEFKEVGVFLAERTAGRVPTYGDGCVAVLERVRQELGLYQEATARAADMLARVREEEVLAAVRARKPARKSKSKKRK